MTSRNDIANEARRHLKKQHSRSPRRRRRLTIRVVIWFIEAMVALAVVEHFLIRPRFHDKPPPVDPPPFVHTGPVAEVSSGELNLPKGLQTVDRARLAPLQHLADGSLVARTTQQQFALDSGLPVEAVNTLGMRFRLVPPGTYLMGSPKTEAHRGESEVEHVVRIPRAIYVGAYEVTQRQWKLLMVENPSQFQHPERPVEEVSWYDCQRFIKALCERESVPWGSYRLPTEEEWEYACRAGTSTAYCCGNTPDQLLLFAEYKANNDTRPALVGRKRPNAYGLYNMHGNVWEWCVNKFYAYDRTQVDQRHRDWRAIRGGNWYVPAAECRSANRARLPPASEGNVLGFRLIRRIETVDGQDNAFESPAAPGRKPANASGENKHPQKESRRQNE